MFVSIFKRVSKDILKIDAKFPLYHLLSIRDFLALLVRETEAAEVTGEVKEWKRLLRVSHFSFFFLGRASRPTFSSKG